jgi:hypothetical protein
MNTEQREQFYRSEVFGSSTNQHMNFRCTKALRNWLCTQALMEKRDYGSVIRRLLTWAAEQEGFDRNGI